MKHSLEFKLGQQLTITPQLQQAIRLLQLSSMELQQEIQEALESNPLLEENEDNDSPSDGEESPAETQSTDDELRATDATLSDDQSNSDSDYEPEWNDTTDFSSSTAKSNGTETGLDIDTRNTAPQTLSDHLYWQMHMTPFSERDQAIATAIIDSINDDGYLTCSLDEIRGMAEEDEDLELDEIEAVLHQIQNFDPLGIGARDLAECLQLQLRLLAPDTPGLETAIKIATAENLGLLGNRDQQGLKKNLKLSQDAIQEGTRLIHEMNPRPGASVNAPQAGYIIPDILIKKVKGIWQVILNREVSPRIRINAMYEKIAREKRGDSNDSKYMQEQLQQARWFIKSLKSRNETLLKVAKNIVDRQRAFFDHGPEAMKPLVLHDIAEAVSMHESTISRVTTAKYMLTPRGVFELKYFFSSHVSTADGGTCSATAIRSLIQKIIDDEPVNKPVSDNKIANLLEDKGINVARRTIAKYGILEHPAFESTKINSITQEKMNADHG